MDEKKDLLLDMNSYDLTEKLLGIRGVDSNLVFSPYALQQLLALAAAHVKDGNGEGVFPSYASMVPLIQEEKFLNTKTGAMILLDKDRTAMDTPLQDKQVKTVSYPTAALQEKKAFQQNILEKVMDDSQPTEPVEFYTAAYYFAKWNSTFDEKLTKPRPFYLDGEHTVMVPTMQQKFELACSEYSSAHGKITPEYEMLSLAGNNHSVVYFIKPKTDPAVIAAKLGHIIESFGSLGDVCIKDIQFEMPKVSVKNEIDLQALLQAAGAWNIANGTTYFEGAHGKIPIQMNATKQLTALEINEEYAKAWAFDFMIATASIRRIPHYIRIAMDQPYFIVIKDQTEQGQQRIVFTAWIANPL